MNQDATPAIARGQRAVLDTWRWLRAQARKPGRSVDQSEVIARITEQGGLSVGYAVMTALSCAIAILGLLLSSPAVIIGAMLISPLMGPIILFGFSLAILDQQLLRRSLGAIALGTVLAVAQSAIIVWLSPLQSATPEILARTHPNFFDLLVAIFSAVAGAYAGVRHRGETIVGVAIATALMPPLAVIGFGLATRNWAIFSGAGGLFMTNLLAIGLTASLVARFYGFGRHNPSHATMWQTIGILAVFAVLSIPLGLSLQRIAADAVISSKVRGTLQSYFAPNGGHIYSVDVARTEGAPVQVDALVLVKRTSPLAESRLQKLLRDNLNRPVRLVLSQVPTRSDESNDQQAIEELTRRLNAMPVNAPPPKPAPNIVETATRLTGIVPLDVSLDAGAKRLLLRTGNLTLERLSALRNAVAALRKQFPNWTVGLRVAAGGLPPVPFAQGSTDLDDGARAALADIVWALHAEGATAAEVAGRSDTLGRSAAANRRAALARARSVAAALGDAGIAATARADYPVPRQAQIERESGRAQFRVAAISAGAP